MRKSLPSDAFLAPFEVSQISLLPTLISFSKEIISSFPHKSLLLQRKNCRSLLQKLELFAVLLESLKESDVQFSPTMLLCLNELLLLLHRSKILIDYCVQSTKIWLIVQNQTVSGYFHDLNQEIFTLLDVFPCNEIGLNDDVSELVELLKRQGGRLRIYVDKNDEILKTELLSFYDAFDNETTPDEDSIRRFFVHRLKMRNACDLRSEIDFLEEQIANQDWVSEPTGLVLHGLVAIARYSRFLLFGFEEPNEEPGGTQGELPETSVSIPKDFCCPITLELMKDPVIVSTGQTYDRTAITRWVDEGHSTCPKTGQVLSDTRFVSNRALRNLIVEWCSYNGISCEQFENMEVNQVGSPGNPAVQANKATVSLLVRQLGTGSDHAKAVSAREVRMLAKSGRENRALIAEAGAIPLLCDMLSSSNAAAQENSVTAMLNLSIYDQNKGRIINEDNCLPSIVAVVNQGLTTEARENAAATLFSLSAVHDYKKRIASESGAVEALTGLLRGGTARGKRDAVTALFNLTTHGENRERMVEAGAVGALVGALGEEGVAEEAAGALALIVKHALGAEAVAMEEGAVLGLMRVMRGGTPRGKENAVAVMLEMCRSGGGAAAERVLAAPALRGLLQSLLFSGTKRARRKAASLAKVIHRCELYAFRFGYGGNSDSNFAPDVSFPMSITVPVL